MSEDIKTNAQKAPVGKVEAGGGTGGSSHGGGTLKLPNVQPPTRTGTGTGSGTGTTSSPSRDGKSPGDQSRQTGGMRSSIGSGQSDTAKPDKRVDNGSGRTPSGAVGTSETGIRKGVGGNAGGTGQQGRDSGERNKAISPPEDVLRVKPKVEKPGAVPFAIQEGATKGKKADLKPEMIAYGVQGAFATISGLTNHDWWEVTDLEADSISQPLTRILNRMDPLQRQLFERYFDPCMLLLAVGMVVAPRLKAEMYLREELKRQSLENARPKPVAQTVPASQSAPKNSNAGPDAVFERRDVIEHFR